MPLGFQIKLRRRWRPAPGWPPAPKGFIPYGGWEPDPAWPTAPAGWRWWGRLRGRIVALGLCVAFVVLWLVAGVQDAHALQRELPLTTRGVTTVARVDRSAYDPDGGDPGGWSSDTITFSAERAETIHAVVGHHGDDKRERSTHIVEVVYDPQQPAVVVTTDYLADATDGTYLVLDRVMLAISLTLATAALVSVVTIRREAPGRESTAAR